jgi:hypothetical protein
VKESIETLVDIVKMVLIGSLVVVLATGVGIALFAVVAAQKLN